MPLFSFYKYSLFKGRSFFSSQGEYIRQRIKKIAFRLLRPRLLLFKANAQKQVSLSSKSNFLDQTHLLTMTFSHVFLIVKLFLLTSFVCFSITLLFASCISLDSLEYGFAICPPFRCTCQRDSVWSKCQ